MAGSSGNLEAGFGIFVIFVWIAGIGGWIANVVKLIALMVLDESYMTKTAAELSREFKLHIDDQMVEQARKRAMAG